MPLSKRILNIVIPVLNEAEHLPDLLNQLAGYRVLVVDGGSHDGSIQIAKQLGAEICQTRQGRGHQLAHGARQTSSEWILFLHADSRLCQGWEDEIANIIQRRQHQLAVFRFRLDDDSKGARRLEKLVAWRCRRFALPYGDQGLLIHRNAYLASGGFDDIPLMEDVAFIRKFSREEICFLELPLITRAERFSRRGYFRQAARNVIFLLLYLAGVPPQRLARLY